MTVPWRNSTDEEAVAALPSHLELLPDLAGPAGRTVSPEHITVILIPEAERDLQQLQDRTGLSRTDIVNRAITLYEFIEAQLAEGYDLLIHEHTGKVQKVELR
jgi:hypothetical protein